MDGHRVHLFGDDGLFGSTGLCGAGTGDEPDGVLAQTEVLDDVTCTACRSLVGADATDADLATLTEQP